MRLLWHSVSPMRRSPQAPAPADPGRCPCVPCARDREAGRDVPEPGQYRSACVHEHVIDAWWCDRYAPVTIASTTICGPCAHLGHTCVLGPEVLVDDDPGHG